MRPQTQRREKDPFWRVDREELMEKMTFVQIPKKSTKRVLECPQGYPSTRGL